MADQKFDQNEKKNREQQRNPLIWLLLVVLGWWLWPAPSPPPSPRILPAGWRHFCHGDQIRGLALSDEHLWVGGLYGLKRFDWRNCADTSAGIATAPVNLVRIEALLIDPAGNLWVAHEMGLLCLDRQGVWHDYTSSLPDPKSMSLCWSLQNELWVGTWRGVAVRSADGKWRHLTVADGLPGGLVRAIHADSAGGIWIGSYESPSGGLLHWNGEQKTVYTTDNLLAHANVAALFEDSQGRMWVGTGFFDRGGVTLFPGWRNGDLSSAKILRQADGIAGNKGRAFFEDRDNIIWIGSELDGLTRVDKAGVFKVIRETDGLNGSEVMSMLQDPAGNLWFGQERGLCRIDVSALASFR